MYYKGTTLRGQKVMTINNRGQAGHGKAISIWTATKGANSEGGRVVEKGSFTMVLRESLLK